MSGTDTRFMALALGLAARGLGNVWPNPAVGCVLVNAGRIVGRGWTQPGGRPHAERMALDQAGETARGATAYVTLEPCAHHGKTPPCAEALISAGVLRVVSACTDPDPRVSGKGHAMLRAAAVEVTEGVLTTQALALNAGFFSRVQRGVPFVTLKLAMSLDGRIANAAGISRWITGAEARRRVHLMRASHDAVTVGIGTALADNPDLSVRDLGVPHQPVRVVIDSHLRLPVTGRLVRSAAVSPVWAVHSDTVDRALADGLAQSGVRRFPCATKGGRIDLSDALRQLADAGLTRVFCEGGAGLAAALLAGGHVDALEVFSAGRVFGAGGTAGVAELAGASSLPDLPEFRLTGHEVLGNDILHRWKRRS